MNSYFVNFLVVSIITPFNSSDAFDFQFEYVYSVKVLLGDEMPYSGLSLPRDVGTLDELAQAAISQVRGAYFNDNSVPKILYTPPARGRVVYNRNGECSETPFHVMWLNTTPEIWIRPRKRENQFYIMIRKCESGLDGVDYEFA